MSNITRTELITAIIGGDLQKAVDLISMGEQLETGDQSSMTPLMYAVSYARHGLVTALLEQGVSINQATRAGRTPLMIAAIKGCLWCAETLIQGGADIDITNERGETALSLARRFSHREFQEYLFHHRPAL